MRYRTRDLLVVGSETGMVPLVDNDVIGRPGGPRRSIAVDMTTGTFYRDHALKDHLAAQKP